jgi:AcrR family transcriptional regulator
MPDRESRKKQTTARRQEQILNAAMEVFARKGFAAATIPEIAKLAGVAAGTIYIYYPSKRELFVAVIENLIVTPLSRIFGNEGQLDFDANLKEALQDRLSIMQSNMLPRFLSLMGEIQRDQDLRDLFVSRLIQPFMSRLEGYYRNQLGPGKVSNIDPAILVRLIGGMIIGLTVLKGLERDASPLNRFSQEEAAAQIQQFIFYGVLGQGNSAKENLNG